MKCRVGDLALVMQPAVPENLGALVEVMAPWPGEPTGWRVRSLSGPRLRVDGDVALEGLVLDEALKPIRGQKTLRLRRARVVSPA